MRNEWTAAKMLSGNSALPPDGFESRNRLRPGCTLQPIAERIEKAGKGHIAREALGILAECSHCCDAVVNVENARGARRCSARRLPTSISDVAAVMREGADRERRPPPAQRAPAMDRVHRRRSMAGTALSSGLTGPRSCNQRDVLRTKVCARVAERAVALECVC